MKAQQARQYSDEALANIVKNKLERIFQKVREATALGNKQVTILEAGSFESIPIRLEVIAHLEELGYVVKIESGGRNYDPKNLQLSWE